MKVREIYEQIRIDSTFCTKKKHIQSLQLRDLLMQFFDEMIQALGCGEHIEFEVLAHCIVEVMIHIQVEIQRQVNIWKWSLEEEFDIK